MKTEFMKIFPLLFMVLVMVLVFLTAFGSFLMYIADDKLSGFYVVVTDMSVWSFAFTMGVVYDYFKLDEIMYGKRRME
jgi:hypothetical protein